MDADVVANYLISKGVLSSSDREDISSADNKCTRLLAKIADKHAYQELFSVLHQTAPQLPAHGKLWGMLNKSCDGMCSTEICKVEAVLNGTVVLVIWHWDYSLIAEIYSSCSLSSCPDVYLEDHVRHLTPIPEGEATLEQPTSRADTACSGRVTEESGYYTHNSASYQSSNRLTQPSFEVVSHNSASYQSSNRLMQPIFEVSHSKRIFTLDVCTSVRGEEGGHESEAATEHLSDKKDEQLERERLTSSKKISPSKVSSPITVPKRNSSSSSLSHLVPPLPEATKCTAATNYYTQQTTEPISHSERTMKEWGYYAPNSTLCQSSRDPCSSELSQQKHTNSLESLVSMSDGFIPFETACCEATTGGMQDGKDDQLERDSVAVSIPKRISPRQVSSPITVPVRNSSSSSLTPLSETAPERPASHSDASPTSSSPTSSSPKLLSSERKPGKLLSQFLKLLFPPSDDVQTVLPGIKQIF